MGAQYPIASDHNGAVCKLYGVYNAAAGIANRTTFVLDLDGKIVDIFENRDAIDVSGALASCSRLKK